jgi:hypothetical protein
MSHPSNAREALIAEVIGDVAALIKRVEAVAPAMNEASAKLRDDLAAFERRMAATTENAKTQTVRHMAARADEAARQSIDQQSRAMADAARVAFGAELGATMQRLQTTLRPLLDRRERPWERWMTHAAAAAVASAATWVLALYVGPR